MLTNCATVLFIYTNATKAADNVAADLQVSHKQYIILRNAGYRKVATVAISTPLMVGMSVLLELEDPDA